ncbi:hypothetical protein EV182_004935, partial [Spiromyces aspiralis]
MVVSHVAAYPAFNTPNSVDVHGNKCPLLPRSGTACPVLCTKSFDDCPSDIRPSDCPTDKQLCEDGTCQDSCANVVNPCLCGFSPEELVTPYVACPKYSGMVTVPAFDPGIKQQQTELACGKQFGILSANATVDTQFDTVPEWKANATNSRYMWLQCPTPQNPTFTFHEPMFISFYSILGGTLALLILWHLYKKLRERGVARLRQRVAALDEDGGTGTKAYEPLLLRGFKRDLFGMFLFCLVLLVTAGWIVLMAVIVSDYYGKLDGTPFGVFLSSKTSSAIFIFVWHLAAAWLGVVTACQHRIKNYFRIECGLPSAHYIQVEERRQEVTMMESRSRLLDRIRYYERLAKRFVGFDIVATTIRVRTTTASNNSHRYIEYHCTRYLQDELGIFAPYVFHLGNTHRELLANASGLTTREARARETRIGENFVQVTVPSVPRALFEEFAAFFYLYQMMCLWVWFYFNYYPMGLVQMGVILISALVKVFIRIKSERKVKSLAEQRAMCWTKRDGRWVELDSRELVPGDLVALTSKAQVLCDGVLVCGETVVDESSLTGEAMPVRKFPLKGDP